MKFYHHISIKSIVFLFAVLFTFTGCIEITEEIKINKNKSGTIEYRIETDQGGSFFSSLTSMFSASIEDQVRVEANKLIHQLQEQAGITNIQYDLNGRSGSFYLQFDFADYQSFNNAIYSVSGNKKTPFTPGYIKIGQSRFKKINFSPWLKKYIEREELELPNPLLTEMIAYKCIVHTPDRIKRQKPTKTVKLASDKKVIQNFNLTEILENKVNTGMKIKY